MSLRTMLALAALAAGLLAASPAHATFPGPNGRITFARFDQSLGDFELYAANPDGTKETQLTTVVSVNTDWSPDGARVAFDFLDPSGNVQIGTLDPASPENVTQLTSGSGFHGEPSWSPDGTRIAFDSDHGSHPAGEGIYTMRSSDGGEVIRLTANPYGWFDIEPAWSPDGQWIAFGRIRSVTPKGPAHGRAHHRVISAIYLVHPDGSGLRRLTSWGIDIASPDWSPDGRWIAFSSREAMPAPSRISLIRTDGSGPHAITSVHGGDVGFGEPVFSPDGTQIMTEGRVDPNGDRQLWVMNADGSALHVLAIAAPVSFPDWGTAPLH